MSDASSPVISLAPPARPWLPWLAAGIVLGALAPNALAVAWGWTLSPIVVIAVFGLPSALGAIFCAHVWPWAARGLLVCASATIGLGLADPYTGDLPESPARLLTVHGEVIHVFTSPADSSASPHRAYEKAQRFFIIPQMNETDNNHTSYHPPRRLYIHAPALPAVTCGDTIRASGLWSRDDYGERIQATLLERISDRHKGPRGWAWNALDHLHERRELGASLILGYGSPPEKDDFRQAGLLHILAVSGSHLAIAAALGVWLLRMAGVSWGVRQCALGFLIIGYTWLTGGNPATIRAMTMGLAILAMGLLAREPHRLATISLTAILLITIDPNNARDLGFLLSLCAVLGIVTVGVDLVHLRERCLPLRPWPLDRPLWRFSLAGLRITCDGLAIGIGATLATVPLIAWTFGTVTPWAPITTLAATPPTAVALWLGLPVMIGAGLWPHGPWDGLYTGVEMSLNALATIVHASAQIPGSKIMVPYPPWWVILPWPLFFLPLTSGYGALWRIVGVVLLSAAWSCYA